MKKYGVELIRQDGEGHEDLVHQAAKNGSVKLLEIFFHTSYDMNTLEYDENTIYPIAEQTFMEKHRIRILHQKWPLWLGERNSRAKKGRARVNAVGMRGPSAS